MFMRSLGLAVGYAEPGNASANHAGPQPGELVAVVRGTGWSRLVLSERTGQFARRVAGVLLGDLNACALLGGDRFWQAAVPG
jgi:hypothetical protein